LEDLRKKVKKFRAEIASPDELSDHSGWVKMVGKESSPIAAQIFYAFYREKRDIKRSDAIDLIHAMYLPYVDLWRGDRAFATLLINNRVNFSERVVPSLEELVPRIEAEVAKC
jgi:hypothetical protein